MVYLRVEITKIMEDGYYPAWAECAMTDYHGNRYCFRDKLPIFSAEDTADIPCTGAVRCMIMGKTENAILINTHFPDDIESLDGKYEFEVSESQIIFD